MQWILVALICPLSMGLMMFFMMRGMRQGQQSAEDGNFGPRRGNSAGSATEVEPRGGG